MKYGKIFEGNLIIKEDDNNDYSELEKVTGHLYINSKAELSALQSVGGSLYINSKAEL